MRFEIQVKYHEFRQSKGVNTMVGGGISLSCKYVTRNDLKGLRHEDFVSLGHFSAKIIT